MPCHGLLAADTDPPTQNDTASEATSGDRYGDSNNCLDHYDSDARVARREEIGDDRGLGVLAAVVSSVLGGTSIGATRFLVNAIDPLAIGSVRFGMGFLLLLPVALVQGHRWPPRHDWPAVAGLGLLFYAAFPILFNVSLIFTKRLAGVVDVAPADHGGRRGARQRAIDLAKNRWRPRRDPWGVHGLADGPRHGARRRVARRPPDGRRRALHGTLQHLVQAFYPPRSGPIPFTTLAMSAGAAVLIMFCLLVGSFAPVEAFGPPQWLGVFYLGAFGSALTFYLWALALGRTTPTRVAISVTVNPVAASLVGAVLLAEPLRWSLAVGIVTVFAGIRIATTQSRPKTAAGTDPVLQELR